MHRPTLPLLLTLAACGAPSTDVNHGLYVNAALGVSLVQAPITAGTTAEAPVKGLVFITRDSARGAQVAATLTVNGVQVPQGLLGYDLATVTLPDVAPGQPVVFHAELGTASADFTVHCPDELTLSGVAEGSSAHAGDSVTVSWGRTLPAEPVASDLMVHGFDPTTGARTTLSLADRVETGKSSDTFALPDAGGAPEWLVDLYATGPTVSDAAGAGSCGLDRRLHLHVQ
jgi:hypothetical protein